MIPQGLLLWVPSYHSSHLRQLGTPATVLKWCCRLWIIHQVTVTSLGIHVELPNKMRAGNLPWRETASSTLRDKEAFPGGQQPLQLHPLLSDPSSFPLRNVFQRLITFHTLFLNKPLLNEVNPVCQPHRHFPRHVMKGSSREWETRQINLQKRAITASIKDRNTLEFPFTGSLQLPDRPK